MSIDPLGLASVMAIDLARGLLKFIKQWLVKARYMSKLFLLIASLLVSVQIPQKSRISQFKISISNYNQILNSVSTFDVKTKKLIFHHLNICTDSPLSGKQSTLFQFVCHLIVRGTTIDIKSLSVTVI